MRPQLSAKEMDRYLLLVIWGEGKVPSAAGGEAESSAEGTEKLPGERGTEKERERLAGRGRPLRSSFCKGGDCSLELSRASATLRRRPGKGWKCRYLHGKHRDKFDKCRIPAVRSSWHSRTLITGRWDGMSACWKCAFGERFRLLCVPGAGSAQGNGRPKGLTLLEFYSLMGGDIPRIN